MPFGRDAAAPTTRLPKPDATVELSGIAPSRDARGRAPRWVPITMSGSDSCLDLPR